MELYHGIIHASFGDLSRVAAVSMPTQKVVKDTFRETKPYYVHLSITGRCNAKCIGCVNSSVTFNERDKSWLSQSRDANPQRDAKAILKLLEGVDEKQVIVSFYGGEPLLLPQKIGDVISILSEANHQYNVKYMIYTNGQLLGETITEYPQLIPKIWLWSVSIDGTREQHNSIRLGTDLEKIHTNLFTLKSERAGEVLMWSTLREEQSLSDCFKEFEYLNRKGVAGHFFWHWVETECPFRSLETYAEGYERDLKSIMEVYVSWLSEGRILSVIHLNELILYLLTGMERGTSACAVEMARNFDIMGGKVHPCADLPPEFAIGTIDDKGEPQIGTADLRSLVNYKEVLGCYQCGVHPYCGGRCPVQAIAGPLRLKDYCQLMRLHVGIVQQYIPEILDHMFEHNITLQDIYDQSAFYAQFTDVTP